MLPSGIQVLERGWLSANNILLRSRDGNVLVDSGYSTRDIDEVMLVGGQTRTFTFGNVAVTGKILGTLWADMNNDGVVDDFDFQMFVVSYNDLICP